MLVRHFLNWIYWTARVKKYIFKALSIMHNKTWWGEKYVEANIRLTIGSVSFSFVNLFRIQCSTITYKFPVFNYNLTKLNPPNQAPIQNSSPSKEQSSDAQCQSFFPAGTARHSFMPQAHHLHFPPITQVRAGTHLPRRMSERAWPRSYLTTITSRHISGLFLSLARQSTSQNPWQCAINETHTSEDDFSQMQIEPRTYIYTLVNHPAGRGMKKKTTRPYHVSVQ